MVHALACARASSKWTAGVIQGKLHCFLTSSHILYMMHVSSSGSTLSQGKSSLISMVSATQWKKGDTEIKPLIKTLAL